MLPYRKLSNGVDIPAIVLGTFQHRNIKTLRTLISNALELGYFAFDTAPSYENEEMLGTIFSDFVGRGEVVREDLFLIDKIDGWQMHETKGRIQRHVLAALQKLQIEYLDLLLIHWPFPQFLVETWEAFSELYAAGMVRSIGLCNMEQRHLVQLAEKSTVLPHVLQIECNPLNTSKEVIDHCHQKNIAIQGYSPVCRMLPALAESKVLKRIAAQHNKTIGQIIMRWHYQNGVAPVFMTSRKERLLEYADIVNFSLSQAELKLIDCLNTDFKIFLGSRACPGY